MSIDWSTLLNITKMVLGSEAVKEFEEKRLPFDLSSFVKILQAADYNLAQIADSVYYGFLVISTKEQLFDLMQVQNLLNINVVETNKKGYYLGIITATISKLKDFIIRCSSGKEAHELRVLANKLYDFLVKEGFNYLFWNYVRQTQSDCTMRLEERS